MKGMMGLTATIILPVISPRNMWRKYAHAFNRQSPRPTDPIPPARTSASFLLIAGALIFLSIFFALGPSRRKPKETVAIKVMPVARVRGLDFTPVVFDAEAFKRMIVENNLFRPLDWTPPRRVEPYRLLGTIHPTDDSRPLTAILQTTAGDRTLIVSTGDQIGASTEVVSIEGKQVTLETDGQLRTLKLTTTHWLNPARVSPRFTSQRQTPVRPPQGVRRTPTRAPTDSPSSSPSSPPPDRTFPLSQWQTREGEAIRIGDARLKNPAKWGLQRKP